MPKVVGLVETTVSISVKSAGTLQQREAMYLKYIFRN